VRDVVAASLVQHRIAGYAVDDAWRFLSRGDVAKLQSDYRTSYAWYQHAYQQMTNGR
jgi:hypothetical protein